MESPDSFSELPKVSRDLRSFTRRPLPARGLSFLLALVGLLPTSCGGVPDLDEAWCELRAPSQATDPEDPGRRLLLARMVLEENTLPSGARARFPLGFAHLVEHLSAGDADTEHFDEFDRLAQAIAAGRPVRAESRLDVSRVAAGGRIALEQQVTIRSTGGAPESESHLWIPGRPPGFPQALEGDDLRVETEQSGGGWRRIDVAPERVGIVGPRGFVASLPAGTVRFRVIYGEGDGLSMPLRSGTHVLPLWLGAERGVFFPLGGAELEVVPSAPTQVQLEGPSVVRRDEVFALELRRTDRFGNVAGESVRPAMELWLEDRVERRFPAGDGNRLTVGGLSRSEAGVVRYRVESADGLVGWSAPILVREEGARLQWADPAAPGRQCARASVGVDVESCVAWAGCPATFPGSDRCSATEGDGILWLDRARFGASIREDWRAEVGRYGVAGPRPGTLAFASLELRESGEVRSAADWSSAEVALLGSALQPPGTWPGESVVARPAATAIWSELAPTDSSPRASDHYATSGARMLIDCRQAAEATQSPRCAIHGTAPVWRIDVLLPVEDDAGRPGTAASGLKATVDAESQRWRIVEEVRPLQTQERRLAVLSWSPSSDGRRPHFVEGELAVADGGISAVALFGDTLETARLGLDGLQFRQLAPPTRGGLLVDLGATVSDDQRIRLGLRIDGRDEVVEFLARQVPFRRPLESGWIESDWVAERPILDLEPIFPELTPAETARAIVLVQQIDGEIGVARFRTPP